ncbi:MAG: effector binding domain-containing protein [Candidatus Bathyarchaeota archaeon]|nr:MAG: effector binding domain-containing protein [Candidatus Bathyarchaeota archaeon]
MCGVDVGLLMSSTDNDVILNVLARFQEDVSFILGTIAFKRRLQLLAALLKEPQTFNKLQKVAKLGKTALAHHLGMLVKAGVVSHTGKGRYEISKDGAEFLRAVSLAYDNSRRRKALEVARRADYIQKAHTKLKEPKMKELNVRIVRLESMHVASVRSISKTPEHDAWAKMHAWAEPKGLLENLDKHPVFGFNNPSPSPGRNEYGYEFWIRVDPETQPEGDVKIKEFKGGLYAVTTCNLKEELESEFFEKEGYLESWKNLVDWVKKSKYSYGEHQGLEKAHDPTASEEELILDLYCPIQE